MSLGFRRARISADAGVWKAVAEGLPAVLSSLTLGIAFSSIREGDAKAVAEHLPRGLSCLSPPGGH